MISAFPAQAFSAMIRAIVPAMVLTLGTASTSLASVTGVFWKSLTSATPGRPGGTRTYVLYAAVTSGTQIVVADLGDNTINLAPAGANTGIRTRATSLMQVGALQNDLTPAAANLAIQPELMWDSFFALGSLAGTQLDLLRPMQMISEGGGISTINGAWFDVPADGAAADPALEGAQLAVRLAQFTVPTSTRMLGGQSSGPSPLTSSIFVYWQDGAGAAGGVFNVPNGTCPGDANGNGTLEVQDIFDFLNAWFAGSVGGDFNGGGLAVQDIFDFLNAWFAGCP